jgi:co-chaperonin GroES (HSP10)
MRQPSYDVALSYPLPNGPRVLVRLLDPRPRDSGLVLPDGVGSRADRGVIVAVGLGYRVNGSDGYAALGFDPGDEIAFFREEATQIETEDGETLWLVHDSDILVVLSPAPEPQEWFS